VKDLRTVSLPKIEASGRDDVHQLHRALPIAPVIISDIRTRFTERMPKTAVYYSAHRTVDLTSQEHRFFRSRDAHRDRPTGSPQLRSLRCELRSRASRSSAQHGCGAPSGTRSRRSPPARKRSRPRSRCASSGSRTCRWTSCWPASGCRPGCARTAATRRMTSWTRTRSPGDGQVLACRAISPGCIVYLIET